MYILGDNIDIDIGMIIAINRQQKGMTQEELSKGICSVPYLSKIENNKITANEEIIVLLLSRLGLSYDNIVSEQKQLNEDILAWYQAIIDRDTNQADQYAQSLSEKIEFIENINLVIHYKLTLLRYHLYKNQLSSALELIDYFTKIKGKLTNGQLLYFYCFYGIYLCMNQQYEEGIQKFEMAKSISDKMRYTEPELIYYLALTYCHLYRPSLTLIYGHQALELFNTSSYYLRSIDCQMMIGISYVMIRQFHQAKYYFDNILNISRKLKLPDIIGKALHNLGYLYTTKEDSSKAIDYYLKSLNYEKDELDYLTTTYYLAKEYVLINDIASATKWIADALKRLEQSPIVEHLLHKFYCLHLEIAGKEEELKTYLEQTVIPFFEKTYDWMYLTDCYEKLADMYAKQFFYKKSSHYYQLANKKRKQYII
ncbi:helix-turn-helix domain-containing protein [Anoxybacteroides rupiense]|uniref:helix-turn-helix domain-containing protein n=1 Tax=Anoxybacteroides rupiense TaxID=311460 RepID=UPI0016069DB2|nr:helix-turn-helix domain-containing protein [Anoxybacillus rupiensis]MBB3906996.1 transcriptional regulator with XRE-family HTH domain [Anoxybacillus rupiensis]